MRLEAPTVQPFVVWHCELCRHLHDIVWVDDVTNEYCQLIRSASGAIRRGDYNVLKHITKVRKIEIILAAQVVWINPLDNIKQEPKIHYKPVKLNIADAA